MSGTIAEESTTTAYGLRLGDGRLLPVGGGLVLGRTPSGSGCLKDPLVSARHARVTCTPMGMQIEDLGSTNGTWVNGQRVVVRVLREGDTVRLGRTLLVAVAPRDSVADADSRLWLLARWERLRARAPRDNYLDWLANRTGMARRRLDEVRRVRNAVAHADGPVQPHRLASALRLISEAERALET
ncbi:FHA domain-containing protein [Streptosporangium sp. NPDC049644]|uniref:FHA domain-containing protein n=1 Tax=Streptosporangium sp. NPDC049644 TaxID=3155507 RepID=UPI0034429EA7